MYFTPDSPSQYVKLVLNGLNANLYNNFVPPTFNHGLNKFLQVPKGVEVGSTGS
jgi:hypothetical protein